MKLFSFITLVLISHWTWAFSDHGHKLVASAAWEQLTPFAKQNVERILGVGKKGFVKASVWADHIKSNDDFNYLKPLHYVNLPKSSRQYDAKRDCPKNACVVEAINDFSKVIKSGSDSEKIIALRMVIHLIADIHQPLHAGLYEDRGGNWYEIKYKKKNVNLHKFWDNHAVKRFAKTLESGTEKILSLNKSIELHSPKTWAEESHNLVLDMVYQAKENKALNDAYLMNVDSIMAQRLNEASWRLAMWLNRLW